MATKFSGYEEDSKGNVVAVWTFDDKLLTQARSPLKREATFLDEAKEIEEFPAVNLEIKEADRSELARGGTIGQIRGLLLERDGINLVDMPTGANKIDGPVFPKLGALLVMMALLLPGLVGCGLAGAGAKRGLISPGAVEVIRPAQELEVTKTNFVLVHVTNEHTATVTLTNRVLEIVTNVIAVPAVTHTNFVLSPGTETALALTQGIPGAGPFAGLAGAALAAWLAHVNARNRRKAQTVAETLVTNLEAYRDAARAAGVPTEADRAAMKEIRKEQGFAGVSEDVGVIVRRVT